MDRRTIINLYHTVKYLKPKQVYYRLYYIFRNKLFNTTKTKSLEKDIVPLNWTTLLLNNESYLENNTFLFLNISKDFGDAIDWNYAEFGKLWTFNLNYFDFLNQEKITANQGIYLIQNFIDNNVYLLDGKEAYTISLRTMNWVKFLSENNVKEDTINKNLYQHCQLLYKNLEYHLLGNHLLENGFALLFAGYYFKDEVFYKKGEAIIKEQLEEQILKDGAHFELSPMYHQIMLHRTLDCIFLLQQNVWKENTLLNFLNNKAQQMLAWLETITYNNGNIPMVNDAAYGIAPTSLEIFKYAKEIGLNWTKNAILSDSGYRVYSNKKATLFVDVGNIQPSYQPAHSHADTFSFELYVNNNPLIVDTGTSTYEKNKKRQQERATEAHNTVKIGHLEQTTVWGGFRVAKRAKVIALKENENGVEATHNGYSNIGVNHTRCFNMSDTKITITDTLSVKPPFTSVAFLHFHPTIKELEIVDKVVFLKNEAIKLTFSGEIITIEKESYSFAAGFNKVEKALKLKIRFNQNIETQIHL